MAWKTEADINREIKEGSTDAKHLKTLLRLLQTKRKATHESCLRIFPWLRYVDYKVDYTNFMHGAFNAVFPARASNGFEWLIRVAIRHPGDDDDELSKHMLTELASSQLILTQTSVRIPKIYGAFVRHNDPANPLGIRHCHIERLPGQSYPYKLWTVDSRVLPKVAKQLAEILYEISCIRFEKCNLPSLADQTYQQERRVNYKARMTAIHAYGYPKTSKVYFNRIRHLQEVEGKMKNSNMFSEGWWAANEEINNAMACVRLPQYEDGPFPLCHYDMHSNNIMFDDNWNITGIIDWAGAVSMPMERFAAHPELTKDLTCAEFPPERDNFRNIVSSCFRDCAIRNNDRQGAAIASLMGTTTVDFLEMILSGAPDDAELHAQVLYLYRNHFGVSQVASPFDFGNQAATFEGDEALQHACQPPRNSARGVYRGDWNPLGFMPAYYKAKHAMGRSRCDAPFVFRQGQLLPVTESYAPGVATGGQCPFPESFGDMNWRNDPTAAVMSRREGLGRPQRPLQRRSSMSGGIWHPQPGPQMPQQRPPTPGGYQLPQRRPPTPGGYQQPLQRPPTPGGYQQPQPRPPTPGVSRYPPQRVQVPAGALRPQQRLSVPVATQHSQRGVPETRERWHVRQRISIHGNNRHPQQYHDPRSAPRLPQQLHEPPRLQPQPQQQPRRQQSREDLPMPRVSAGPGRLHVYAQRLTSQLVLPSVHLRPDRLRTGGIFGGRRR